MDKNRYFQIRSGKYIKTKVADIQRLYSKWLWLLMAISKPSLSLMKIDPYRITLLLSGYFSAYTQHEHEQYTFNIKKHLFVI